VASTGVHGANRLAGNSLLEGLVFGERVARQLLHPVGGNPTAPDRLIEVSRLTAGGEPEEPALFEDVRSRLWDDVGIVRSGRGLGGALEQFETIAGSTTPSRAGAPPGPVSNAAMTASLIARAALARTESRGAHFRSDWPRPRATWRRHIGLRLRAPPARRSRRADNG
jgi:aspartate oxidase